jgi:hypothetical protein
MKSAHPLTELGFYTRSRLIAFKRLAIELSIGVIAPIERLDFLRSLAVEAVIGEPVSVSEFPVSRENTGKFAA